MRLEIKQTKLQNKIKLQNRIRSRSDKRNLGAHVFFIALIFLLMNSATSSADNPFDPDSVIATPTSAVYYGTVQISGAPGSSGDQIGAFDPDGIMCGAWEINTDPGFYGLMAVYGDDPETPEDEGAETGDSITFRYWDQSTDIIYNHVAGDSSWNNGTTEQYDINIITGSIQGQVSIFNNSGNLAEVEITTNSGNLTHPDSTGFYQLDVSPGIYNVTASLNHYRSSTIYNVEVLENQVTENVDFLLYPRIFFVNWDGTADFESIQAAIDCAVDGDTIIVHNGSYLENIDYLDKSLIIGSFYLLDSLANHIDGTIIDGNQNGTVVTFSGTHDTNTKLVGVTITHGSSINGGGIYCGGSASVEISHVKVINNFSPSGSGGGIYIAGDSLSSPSPHLNNVTIANNTANYGGGLYLINSNGIFDSLRINNNTANSDGGGIYSQNSDPTLTELLIYNNFSTANGGGFYCNSSSPIIKKITVTKNSVEETGSGGGIYFTDNSSPSISNSLIAFNTGEGIHPATSDNYINLRYSDIFGNTPENFGAYSNPDWGELVQINANGDSCDIFYNLVDDPHFNDIAADDFHLLWESPCIDAGDPLSPPDPDGTVVDIGFYSFDQNVVDADFSGTPQIGIAPLAVGFSDRSCPGTGEIISWEWDFGDGTDTTYTSSIPLLTHTYQDTGHYTIKNYDVSLTIISATPSGNVSDTKIKSNYLTVYEPVNALFLADSTTGIAPFETQFHNLTTGAYDSLFWDMGDSTYLTTMADSFFHTYADTGSYTVKLFASGNGGTDSLISENYINVFGEIIVDFTADATDGIAPFTVNFLNFSTGVFDTLHWYFGDGAETITTEDTVSHTYQDSGYYDVTLAISNDAVTDSLTKDNYIHVFSPVEAIFQVEDSTLISGNQAIFTNESSGDINVWHWFFGDGADTTLTSNVDTIRHTYNVFNISDTFSVKLIVSGMGGVDTLRKDDLMSIYAETDADFESNTNSSIVPFWVEFTDNSTGDYSTWSWDFGDGNTLVNSEGQAGSDSVDASQTDSLTIGTYQNPIHKYDSLSVGVLDVSLLISGNGGVDSLRKTNNIFVYPKSNLIWPGDTDYDGIVDANDIYNIGTYWNEPGTPRNEPSLDWTGNNYPGNWENPMAALADCNGDSLVNVTDALAMCLNMDKTHAVVDTKFTYLQPPRNYEKHRNNFIDIYHTLGTSRNELLIRNHIATIFDLAQIEEIENNFLNQNFPNPVTNTTKIQFGLKNSVNSASLKIYNIKGQLVKSHDLQNLTQGFHSYCWDGKNNNNTHASNGIYFYLVNTKNWKSEPKKMILMK